MSHSLLLTIMLILPFAGAFIAVFLPQHARNEASLIAWIVALAGIVCASMLYPAVLAGGIRHEIEWLPDLGLDIVLRLDGLSWIFSVLVLGIGSLVVLYARYYMSPQDSVSRFFSYFLAFMGAMLGIVMSGNLIQLVIFWELTSLFSFLLIGFWHHHANSRDGARIAFTVTATGGLCLLAGVLLLGRITDSFDLDVVLASGDIIREHPLYLPTLILILIGAFTKSAQFPFFFWLPLAMAAPTPVSAYLHSATMVKAGIFLLIRLWPVLAGTDSWILIVGSTGLITLLLGAYMAVFQHDLKGLLAYSTISHLGLITLLLGMGSPLAMVAAIFHTLNHATFKASLFMAAGIIDHETGTRDMRKLSGLFRYMPNTATLAMVASAAMAGVPLLNGFISKEMFFAETIGHDGVSVMGNYALPILATIASACTVLYSLRFFHQTFFGPAPENLSKTPHEPPHWMRFPIALLVLICLVVGIFPQETIGSFLHMSVGSVLGEQTPSYSLAVWHGFNPALIMSLFALAGGCGLYVFFRGALNNNTKGPTFMHLFRGQKMLETVTTSATLASRWLERRLSTRRLQTQLRIVLLMTLFAGMLAMAGRGTGITHDFLPPTLAHDPMFSLLWVVGCLCAIGAAYMAKHHRLAALIFFGVTGLVNCLTFVWLSAPDLALTQLLVEIVTTVLLLLGLRWLPKRKITVLTLKTLTPVTRPIIDMLIAASAGLGMALVAYAGMTRPSSNKMSDFFLEHAYSEAGGRNVVNVLLVDFRALDTLGEIAVLGIVGLTVFALFRRFRPAADSLEQPVQQRLQNAFDLKHKYREIGDTLHYYLLIPRHIVQWLFPPILVVTTFLFLRGHDLPGGGFAAGITMSIGIILQYIVFGVRWVESRLTIRPIYWVATGLLLVSLTGLGSLVLGYPFLTSSFHYLHLPLLGKLPMASALLFDLGVFIVVVGSTTLTLIAIAHQSIRKPHNMPEDPDDKPAEIDAVPAPAPVKGIY